MTNEELLECLLNLRDAGDPAETHREADEALLKYIDLPEITAAFMALKRWYE